MNAGVIAALIAAVVVLLVLVRSVRIVPQARAAVIERLGRYVRTATPGLTMLVPFVDRMRPLIDLREQVVSFPPQPVITSDNLTVGVDSVIYFQVTDPRAATYEIANYIQAVEQLTITTLRNVIGSLNLEQALTSRDEINSKLRGVLDEATGPWGIRVARVEIKAIDPPPSIQDAMEQQMRADRNKRALILTAEGQRESAIKTAEGNKAAQILAAEGQKQAAILEAEAERQSRILRAEGERAARYLAAQGQAKAIETTFNAIHDARPDPALLAYQYLQTLPQIAQGESNKMWIVPSEFSRALDGLARLGGGGGESGEAPPWLAAQSADPGETTPIDTEGWFDSNLPPASAQPEAANIRASDDDADSQAAQVEGAGAPDVAEILRERVPTADDPPDAPQPPAEFPREPPAEQPPGYKYPPQEPQPPGYQYPQNSPYQPPQQ
jgi:regulator of protease activity HflC (stomatin/prohibitin superfamily)